MPDTPAPAAGERSRLERLLPADSWLARALHVFVLSALAIAQPLWSLLEANPEFFVARRADRAEIVVTALLILLVPPLVVLAVEALARLAGDRAVRVVHALAVAGFVLLLFLRVLTRAIGDPAVLVLLLAALAAAGVTAYYLTTVGVRRVLTALGPAPLVFLAVFLLSGSVRPLVFPAAAAKTGAVAFEKTPPVVFLVFDEFPLRGLLTPDMQIDATRVPNLAAFAKTSTWYRKASTVHEVSEMAVPAILTGIRSEQKRLPTSANFPVNVFSVFTAGGYDVRAAEVLTRVCTEETCGGQTTAPAGSLKARVKSQLKDLGVVYGHQVVPPSIAARQLPEIGLTWGNFGAAVSEDPDAKKPDAKKPDDLGPGGVRADIDKPQEPRLEEFLAGLVPSPLPTLHYGHLLMPHAPYTHLPNGKPYAKNKSFIGINMKTGFWDDDEFVTDQAEQRTILQIGYTDRQIGRILDKLKQSGLFDDALIVVASDHGSTNRPKLNRRAFAPDSIGDIGSVPLFVKLPGQTAGETSDVNAQTVDILPTVADALGFTIPGQVSGHSLLDPAGLPADKTLVNQFGKTTTLAADFPESKASVERMYSRFAHDGDRLNVFASGPYKALVGKPWGAYGSRPGTLRATLDSPEFWTTGAPEGISPAHQTGTLQGLPAGVPRGTPVHLLVAVGDTVVATSRSYDVTGEAAKLDVFVPDEALAPGHAPVRLFAVSGDPSRPELTPVAFG